MIGRGELAAVQLDDRAADRQPDAEAIGFGGVERVEDAVQMFARDAAAGVAYGERREARVQRGRDRDQRFPGGAIGDAGVNRVLQEVEHHLLQLETVAADARQAGQKAGRRRSDALVAEAEAEAAAIRADSSARADELRRRASAGRDELIAELTELLLQVGV